MTEPRADIPGAIGSALIICIGAVAFWAAAEFSSLGSVFPRAIGALLVALGSVYVILVALGRTRRAAAPEGSNLRRTGVAVVMLAWGFALGPLGFLPSSAAAVAALLLIANPHQWTLRTALLYGSASALVLGALYALFKLVLLVPLP